MKIAGSTAFALLVALAGCTGDPQSAGTDWYTAWAVAHNARVEAPAPGGRTVRMILLPNIPGNALRVKLENTMGEAPLVLAGAAIGVAGEGAAVRQESITRLTFAGKPGLTLAPGQGAYSDPVAFDVKAFEKLALSLDVQSASDISTHHLGLMTNWSAPGVRAADPSGAGFEPLPEIPALNTGQWPFYWVAALDVQSPGTSGTIVFLADSITDGRCSTRDAEGVVRPNLYQRWTDVLAARLAERPSGEQKGIANAGISGNRVLGRGNGPSALERLERDVFDRAGVTHVVLFEGTNDLAGNFTAAQVVAGMRQIVALLRSRGIKVIGATAIPRGRPAPETGWTAGNEAERIMLNEWVRANGNFDGVIDFDALMKNGPVVTLTGGAYAPAIPAEWNCDYTHPNAAGYKAMGEFVDLELFR